jgi:hypothetical protein
MASSKKSQTPMKKRKLLSIDKIDKEKDFFLRYIPEPIRNSITSNFQSKEWTDLTIICGDMSFYVHKMIVCKTFGFFEKMVNSKMKEAHHNSVMIEEYEPQALLVLLRMAYFGKEKLKDMDIMIDPILLQACRSYGVNAKQTDLFLLLGSEDKESNILYDSYVVEKYPLLISVLYGAGKESLS